MAKLTQRFFMGGNPADVETLFIMESPGKCELVCNYACVGKTGNIMSKYLYSDDSVPLGCYLEKKLKKNFAVFETFVFPIEEKLQNNNNAFEINMTQLKEIDKGLKKSTPREEHYDKLDVFWNNSAFSEEKKKFVGRYKIELQARIDELSNLKEIVVCGFIAQSCFMQAFIPDGFKDKFPPYGCPFSMPSFNPKLFFSNHPSVELYAGENKWKYGEEYQKRKK